MYDQIFGVYFKGIEQIQSSDILNIPDEWLRKNGERLFSREELEKIKSQGDLESLLDRMAELLKEQKSVTKVEINGLELVELLLSVHMAIILKVYVLDKIKADTEKQ